jgi:hypothetical protein
MGREQDDGYVTLNVWKRHFSVFPDLSGKSIFGSWSTFLHRDIFANYGKIPNPISPSV